MNLLRRLWQAICPHSATERTTRWQQGDRWGTQEWRCLHCGKQTTARVHVPVYVATVDD